MVEPSSLLEFVRHLFHNDHGEWSMWISLSHPIQVCLGWVRATFSQIFGR